MSPAQIREVGTTQRHLLWSIILMIVLVVSGLVVAGSKGTPADSGQSESFLTIFFDIMGLLSWAIFLFQCYCLYRLVRALEFARKWIVVYLVAFVSDMVIAVVASIVDWTVGESAVQLRRTLDSTSAVLAVVGLGLLVLLSIHATRKLRENGVRVGLMGARKADLPVATT